MSSRREATLSDLAGPRQELIDALGDLSDTDLESPLGPVEWRLRDILAHINH